ncbi:MAG TPA: DoxX family protein [Gemmatimonadaceae bacterium]|jgi:putative oxidoreductase
MFRKLLSTSDERVLLLIRLALGIVMFPHGAQKALGWYGGGGIDGTIGFFGQMGIPAFLAMMVIAAEFVGSILLVVGFLGRVAAFGIACVMLGATIMVHVPNGFFMNWSGQQAGEGFEYHILALTLAVVIMWRGSGAASIDRALTHSTFVGETRVSGYGGR